MVIKRNGQHVVQLPCGCAPYVYADGRLHFTYQTHCATAQGIMRSMDGQPETRAHSADCRDRIHGHYLDNGLRATR